MTFVSLLELAVVVWLPGAVIFRLPFAQREKREALDAEERLFWAVVISLCVTLSVVLALAAARRYSFDRLVLANLLITAGLAIVGRLRLRFGSRVRRLTPSALIPLALVAVGVWRFFPASEYVIGGKDPGVYVNAGILIAQRGTLVYEDPVVAAVPHFARDLFFPSHGRADYYGVRFMGFFIKNPDSGAVVGQFPHLFPASVAVAYGLRGLTGAREAVGFWAIVGLLSVYFVARRITGPAAASAAAILLALHVIEVWFARYPNAEMVMQALLFAAILASVRAHADDDRFFAPVGGLVLGLLLFLRFDAVLAIAGIVAALIIATLNGGRIARTWVLTLGSVAVAAFPYYTGPLRAYIDRPIVFLNALDRWQYAAVLVAPVVGLGALAAARRWPASAGRLVANIPTALSAAVVIAAIYALYFRRQAGKLAAHDAYALRTFTAYYATLPALLAALIGFVTTTRRAFWRAPEFFITVAIFSFFLFYKIYIVPEHFWMARRFVAVILPGMLIFACAAAAWGRQQKGPRRLISSAIGVVFVVLLGSQYARAARPVADHVEYAGIIPQLELLAGKIADNELLIVESRDAGSDAHVMALPLAYIYARNVLVLFSPRPDQDLFAQFLEWARTRYGRVYFLGGGGTELLSQQWTVSNVESYRFQVPEYEVSQTSPPRSVRKKEFDFGLHELLPRGDGQALGFDLDVGVRDDLHVVRFHAKETANGQTMRWSQRQSFVTVPRFPDGAGEIVLVMSSGGRPDAADPPDVQVYLNDTLLGSVRVTDGFHPYTVVIPPDVSTAAATSSEPSRIRLVTPVWNPHQVLGSADDRELGVMLDRVQVR